MTEIEVRTMNAVQNACRKYTNSTKTIDWEERRYEIAKEVIGYISDPTPEGMAEKAVTIADALINELKKGK